MSVAASSTPSESAGLVRSAGRPDEIVAFEDATVKFFVDAADVGGLPKSVAAIYGIVFASPQPLTFAEICERLDLSKGSVSQSLKVLREMGAVKELSIPSDRSERFAPDLELKALVAGFLRAKVQPHLVAGDGRLTDLSAKASEIKGLTVTQSRVLRERMEKLGAWHRKAQAVIPLITKFFR